MHNHRSLLNMDISGGLPSVLIQMLIASAPGKVRLLPALPKAWPTGTIEGALCRGQIEVRQLTWAPGQIRVSLLSGREQTIELSVPAIIQKITATSGTVNIAPAGDDRARKVMLPQGRAVTLEIEMP